MRRRLLSLTIMAVFLFVGTTSAVAAYTSTFNLTETDFALTGFSAPSNTGSYTEPTNGPDTLVLTDPSGSYNLNLPTGSGNYDWYVNVESLDLYFGPYTPNITLSDVGPVYIGNFPTPGVWNGSYHVGNYYVPGSTYMGNSIGDYTLENVNVAWNVAFNGTDITEMALTLDADNLIDTLNRELTALDYADGSSPSDPTGNGYKNGSIDGHVSGVFSITAVPEPATIVLLGAGLLGLVGISRRRK